MNPTLFLFIQCMIGMTRHLALDLAIISNKSCNDDSLSMQISANQSVAMIPGLLIILISSSLHRTHGWKLNDSKRMIYCIKLLDLIKKLGSQSVGGSTFLKLRTGIRFKFSFNLIPSSFASSSLFTLPSSLILPFHSNATISDMSPFVNKQPQTDGQKVTLASCFLAMANNCLLHHLLYFCYLE
jgi:hypothetical protein